MRLHQWLGEYLNNVDRSDDYLKDFEFYSQDYDRTLKRLFICYQWIDVDRLYGMVDLIEFQKYWIYKKWIEFGDPKNVFQKQRNEAETKWMFKAFDLIKRQILSQIPWNNIELDPLTWLDKSSLEEILRKDFNERSEKMKSLIQSVRSNVDWQNKE